MTILSTHYRDLHQRRGYAIFYRPGERNVCPGCGRSCWHVGRTSAECGYCETALDLPFGTRAGGTILGRTG